MERESLQDLYCNGSPKKTSHKLPLQVIAPVYLDQDFGLSNGRNQFNCFLNSVLQLLFNVKMLRSCIGEYSKNINLNNQTPESKVIDRIVVSFSFFRSLKSFLFTFYLMFYTGTFLRSLGTDKPK